MDNSGPPRLPTNTDWVDSIYTLVTLYHKPNGSYGFTNALFVSLAFATHSLAPLALQRLRLLRCYRGNPSPALSPHERRINLITGLQYNTPIAVRHFSLVAPVSDFPCGFLGDASTDLIVANPLGQFECLTDFKLVVVQN